MSNQDHQGASASGPGSQATPEAPVGLRPSGFDPSRKPSPPMGRGNPDDDFVVGYMCLVDYECELGCASGGNVVYPSIEDIREQRKCVASCGVVEVEVRGRRIVQEATDLDLDTASAIDARSDETAGLGPKGESAVPKADAPSSSPYREGGE